jgi:DNA-binding transcriptional LysR family regulator
MQSFDWEDFRHFAALARTLHLGKAAQQLESSEATVMRRVRHLEKALGTTLFVRRRDGHRLTPMGEALTPVAYKTEDMIASIPANLRGQDLAARGRVRIATTEVVANWILLPHLSQFLERRPEIMIEIDASPNAIDLTEDHETIALRFSRTQASNFITKKIGTLSFAFYGSPQLLAKGDNQNFDSSLPYLGWIGSFAEIQLADWLRKAFDNRPAVASFTSLHAHIEVSRRGLGVTCLPVFIGHQLADLTPMTHVKMSPLTLDAWLVVPAQSRRVARIKAAAQFIEDAFSAVDTYSLLKMQLDE